MQSCKKCYFPEKEDEKSILENIKDNFIELFGEEQYKRVYQDVVINNKDSFINLPNWFEEQIKQEQEQEIKNEIPKIRNNESKNF